VNKTLNYLFFDQFNKINGRIGKYDGSEMEHNRTCIAGTRKLFCSADGNFHMCEKLGHGNHIIGNYKEGINTERVIEIMNGVQSIANEFCSNCWATPICNLCIPVSSLSCGTPNKERLQKSCEKKKENMKKYLKAYIELNDEFGKTFTDSVRR